MNKNLTNFYLFFGIVGVALLTAFLTNQLLISDDLYYNSLGEQFTVERIEGLIKQGKKWVWLGYVFVPLIYLLKFSIIALVLLIGSFFFDKNVSFSILFRAVMLAELPMLAIPLIKIGWFLFFQPSYTLHDLQYFFPLSAIQLFEVNNLEVWQIYPLQLFNAFELLYWVLLAYWLGKLLDISITKGMEIVLSSYGTGLLVWVVFVTFLILNVSP